MSLILCFSNFLMLPEAGPEACKIDHFRDENHWVLNLRILSKMSRICVLFHYFMPHLWMVCALLIFNHFACFTIHNFKLPYINLHKQGEHSHIYIFALAVGRAKKRKKFHFWRLYFSPLYPQIKDKIDQLQTEWENLIATWDARNAQCEAVLDSQLLTRDLDQAEAWLNSRTALLKDEAFLVSN